jgi:hypothetical protein
MPLPDKHPAHVTIIMTRRNFLTTRTKAVILNKNEYF